jgi:hypothetical protein
MKAAVTTGVKREIVVEEVPTPSPISATSAQNS